MINYNEVINKDGRLIIAKGIFSHLSVSDLKNEVTLEQERIKMFGKELIVPRLVAYQGELGYKYSGVKHRAKMYTPISKTLIEQVAESVNFRFNSALFNYYATGEDYMGYHKDDEPEIDHTYVASLSFGATRKFNCRHIDGELISLQLEHGDLLIMENFQVFWKHALPKTKKVHEPRLNLTFRKIISE